MPSASVAAPCLRTRIPQRHASGTRGAAAPNHAGHRDNTGFRAYKAEHLISSVLGSNVARGMNGMVPRRCSSNTRNHSAWAAAMVPASRVNARRGPAGSSRQTERRRRGTIRCSAANVAVGPGDDEGVPPPNQQRSRVPPWQELFDARPRMDETDYTILKLWGPAVLNLILPTLLGAVDVFWVGRMNDAAALAGQGAANQVFDSMAFVVSFIPVLITPLVAKASASGDKSALQRQVGEAILLSSIMGGIGMAAILLYAPQALSAVGVMPGSEIASHAVPCMLCRAISFIPCLAAYTAFATYRGMMDVVTPLKVSGAAQLLNAALDPILIFGVPSLGIPAMGVAGAALATATAECLSFCLYMVLLVKQDVLRWASLVQLPRLSTIWGLAVGGVAVQMRTIALNVVFLTMTKTALAMDANGTAAAAHTITTQVWRVSLMALLAQSGIASAMVPQAINRPGGGIGAGKAVADRLLVWGLYAGLALGAMQLLALPLLKVFTTVPEVQQAAVVPCMVGALVQSTNGMVFVGEGIMQGHQAFARLALHFVVGAAALLLYLQMASTSLAGMWFGFWLYTNIRLVGALQHHFVSGPLAYPEGKPYSKP